MRESLDDGAVCFVCIFVTAHDEHGEFVAQLGQLCNLSFDKANFRRSDLARRLA